LRSDVSRLPRQRPIARPSGRILVVEDNEDMQELMEMALRSEGYEVDIVASAEEGLRLVASTDYQLVIADYRLPHHDGGWLLRQAFDRGFLPATRALIITAEPDAAEVTTGVDVLTKPVDFDALLSQVRAIMDESRKRADTGNAGGAIQGPVVELVLYVTPESLPCQRALRVIRDILGQYQPEQVDFRVQDLTEEPAAAERDRIIFTPTLVKKSPPPHVWVLGDLARPEVVTDLLHLCGVTPVTR
jgi:DNA-binding response OmpR family regulator